ncbi:hypothetical protein F4780DRAFT_529361 [Xylariomycetidae sp. FL0641]|nr:hypothetical protein F4780DRAFT_529361 [Xylariomycetidae sp. FL0641]
MAPKTSKTAPEPTLYEILSLTRKDLDGQGGPAVQKTVKHAYHRALLRHHPDKNQAAASQSGNSSPSESKDSSSKPKPHAKPSAGNLSYSVDQIQHAYAVLSDGKQRSAYDRTLTTTATSSSSYAAKHEATVRFHTGVETVDLDDVAFSERSGVYYRSCRCGNPRGYAFRERDLEACEDDGVLLVECQDCSLWLRVLFTAEEDEDEDEAAAAPQQQQQQHNGGATEVEKKKQQQQQNVSAGGKSGSGKGNGFRFSFGFNLGVSLSGSAGASGK